MTARGLNVAHLCAMSLLTVDFIGFHFLKKGMSCQH